MTRAEFYDALFVYCSLMGASTTSSIRSEVHNKKVGGVLHSAHIFGLGADVVYDSPVADVAEARARRLGLKLIREGDHDHLQPLEWGV